MHRQHDGGYLGQVLPYCALGKQHKSPAGGPAKRKLQGWSLMAGKACVTTVKSLQAG